MPQNEGIRVYHTGRIARSRPTALCPSGMLWSRDMRFFYANVPAGDYALELRMKETQRFDAGSSDAGQPRVNIYVNGRLAAGNVKVQTERPEDDFVAVAVPVFVRSMGFDVRIYQVTGGLNLPCVYGMRLLKGKGAHVEVVHQFMAGDAAERAMWAPAEIDAEAGTTRCTKYEELLHSGVPLGGLGTGRLEILTNGTLGSFSCANNWDVPTFWTEGSFFALWTNAGQRPLARLLHPPRHSGGWLAGANAPPAIDAINYEGRFPAAELAYEIAGLPLEVRMRAQGSLVPGSAQLSSLPAATFTFSIKNTGPERVEAAVLASLENLAGQGGYYLVTPEWQNVRERFDSVNGAFQEQWQAGSLKGLLFTNDREPQSAARRNAFTDYALACEGHGGVSRCIAWNVNGEEPDFWRKFALDGTLPKGGFQAKGADGEYRPAGAVAKKISIDPGQTKEIVFVLAWYHSGHVTFRDEVDHGHAYEADYATIGEVASAARDNREIAASIVDRLQQIIRDSTLPRWLQTKLINGAFPATTCSVWTNDGLFSMHESPTEMAGAIGTIDQRMAAHPFTFIFFPELDRCELEWFRRCQQPDGQIPHMIGNVYDKLGAADTFFCVTGWPDLSCSFILQTYRHFLYSGDRDYLAGNLDAYDRAVKWMQSTDKLGLGLPVGGCTYDYEQHEWKVEAPMIVNASCYLGALRAAIDAAKRLDRLDLADSWSQAFDKARNSLMTLFWNGRYFRKWVHPQKKTENGNCFVAQLAGDWFARLLGLEPIFPDEIVDSVLDSIVELNMRPHHPAIPMEVSPAGELAVDSCYIQQHEPYLGMELIYRGRVKDGLEVLHRRQEITWRVNSNPWGEALAVHAPSGREMLLFDYMTATAGWNVLYALAGATVDADKKTLRFRPQLNGARAIRLPVFLHDLWLVLDVNLDREKPVSLKAAYRGALAAEFEKVAVELPELGGGLRSVAVKIVE